jgi:cell wall-associated NlpC family hydrolase
MHISSNPRVQHVTVYIGDGMVVQDGGVHPWVNVAAYTQMPYWASPRHGRSTTETSFS